MSIHEEMIKEMQETIDRREETTYGWLRYLIGLAAGALTVLVALGKGFPHGKADVAHKCAATSLSLGILLGSIRAIEEVRIARVRVTNLVANVQSTLSGQPLAVENLSIPSRPWATFCEKGFYAMLILALISLMFLAWNLPISI
jgi:hypothetical protein